VTSVQLNVIGDSRGEPTGYDAAIAKVPDGVYVTIDGQRVLNAKVAARALREIAELSAARLGERLHHAEWTLTSDPEQVRTLGLMHDCATCRAGVDQATAYLRETPGGEVAVGQLWWAP
jgi:hypothetical protein